MSQKIKLRTAKVLVVDDEPEITDIVQTFLTESGYSVDVLNNPRDAVTKAKQFKPDVILLDIMMPKMDGCQFLRQYKAGGDMFIKKPFSCERLLEIVNIVVMSTSRF